jgi:hypothetical protein
MRHHTRLYHLSIVASSVTVALLSTGCGGTVDAASAVTEAAVAGSKINTLDLEESGKRRRDSNRAFRGTALTTSSADVVPTTTTSAATSTATQTIPITTIINTTQSTQTPTLPVSTSNIASLPLVQNSDFEYMGAFALPEGVYGDSQFSYGGRGLTVHRDAQSGATSLFMQGHNQFDGKVGQIQIPTTFVKSSTWEDLVVANVLQPFRDVTDGEYSRNPSSIGDISSGAPIYGLLSYNNKLIVGVTIYYSTTQEGSHGVSSLNLSEPSDFRGFFKFSSSITAKPRALGGEMNLIPAEWQAALGGKAMTGNQAVPLISATSAGPAVTVFDPDQISSSAPIDGNTLMYYPLSSPVCGAEGCVSTSNPVYNGSSMIRGRAIIPGTRSLLFFGKHGLGEFWYGGDVSPTGKISATPGSGNGYQSEAYEARVWSYDLLDLKKVKEGLMKPWDIKPNATWRLSELTALSPNANFTASAYDEVTGLLYIIADSTQKQRVHVYKVRKF